MSPFDPYDIALAVVAFLLLLSGGTLLVRLLGRRRRASRRTAFLPRDRVFSAAERELYRRLDEALNGDGRILLRLNAADLLEPPSGIPPKDRQTLMQRLRSQKLDAVICAPDLSVRGILLLEQERTSAEDEDILQALMAAGVPVVILKEGKTYSVADLRSRLERMRPSPASGEEDWRLGAPEMEAEEENWLAGLAAPEPLRPPREHEATGAELLCPACGTPMIRRKVARGAHAGRELWVCPNYPRCKKVLPVLQP